MFSVLKIVLALSSLAGSVLAQSTCTIPALTCSSPGPQTTYLAEPCYPTTGVCYSPNYYAVGVAVSFSAGGGDFTSQLKKECEATCDSQSQCLSYTGQLVVAGPLAVGTCFFYSVQQISPRQCVDAPTTIIAYYKQKVCGPVTTKTTKSTTTTMKTSTTTTSSTTKAVMTSSSSTTTSTTDKPTTTTSTSSTTSPSTISTTTSSTTTSTTTTTTPSTTSSSTTTTTASTTTTTTASTTTSTTTSTTISITTSTTSSTTASTTASSTTSSTTMSTTTSSTTSSTTASTTTLLTTTSSTTTTSTTPAASATNCVQAQASNPYVPSGDYCGCTYSVTCGSYNDPANQFPFTATSVADCASQCDSYSDCYQFEYDFMGNCFLYNVPEDNMPGTNAISGRTNCANNDCAASEETLN